MASIPYRIFKSNVRAKSFIRDGVKSITATATATKAGNAGRTNTLNAAAGLTVTLPASSGNGAVYRFAVGTLLTSNSYIIKVANATDVMAGGILINDTGDSSAGTADFFPTAATSDTITMAASAGAGKVGDWVELEDIKSGFWSVRGTFQGELDPTTPFSATVS